jgi:alpha-tubulin suppressor-like RCC1 family protein
LLTKAGKKIIAISAGREHSIFLGDDGTVYTCGINTHGQLGRIVANGSATSVNLGQISSNILPNNIIKIASGGAHSIFLSFDGTVYNCGNNDYNQLGRIVANGSATSVNLGQMSSSILPSNIFKIICGITHSIFLSSDGIVYTCGRNNYNQLGRAVSAGSATVINLGQISSSILPSNIIEIAAHETHSIFLSFDGTVYNCGNNDYNQLGRAVATGSATSVNLGQISPSILPNNIIKIACGRNQSIFLSSNGTVYTCGINTDGNLGRIVADGSATSVNLGQISTSVLPNNIIKIASGNSHSIFLSYDGIIYNCGSNTYNQLGRATLTSGSATVVNLGQISSSKFPSNVIEISGGTEFSLFILLNRELYTCGKNNYNQLGRDVASGAKTTVNLGQIDNNLFQ